MGWIMIRKDERVYGKVDSFRLCHECGGRIEFDDPHIMDDRGHWVFHPHCGVLFQERELELQKEIVKQLEAFEEECESASEEEEKE